MNDLATSLSARNTPERTLIIRRLNDALRCKGEGGRVMITAGILALPLATQAAILEAVAHFDHFTEANDPLEEHDFGVVRAGDHTAVFKVDYYDCSLTMHSPDPAVAAVTIRVLTIMTPTEF